MFVFVVVVGDVVGSVVATFVAVVDIFINVLFFDVFVVGFMGDVASVAGIVEESVDDVLFDGLLDDDCVVVDGVRMVVVGVAEPVVDAKSSVLVVVVVVFADSVVAPGAK